MATPTGTMKIVTTPISQIVPSSAARTPAFLATDEG